MYSDEELWDLIGELHLHLMEFFIEYSNDENYSEEKFKENVILLDKGFERILELLSLPEYKDFSIDNAEELTDLFVNFDLLKKTCDIGDL